MAPTTGSKAEGSGVVAAKQRWQGESEGSGATEMGRKSLAGYAVVQAGRRRRGGGVAVRKARR